MKCYRRIMNISWKDKKTNEYVREKVKEALGQRDIPGLVEIIKTRKLKYFGHQMRKEHSLAATVTQGKVNGCRGKGRPRRKWGDDLRDWTGYEMADLKRMTGCRET